MISFESRLRREAAALLERHGARVVLAPALKEVPLSDIPDAKVFAEAVRAGAIDALILLTGVGVSLLLKAATSYASRAELVSGLSKITLVCRGPKPAAALKPTGLRPTLNVPEPNTWRELVQQLDVAWPVAGRRVWLQEYGSPSEPLVSALQMRGARVRSVHVYRWVLPDDTAPLKAAVLKIVRGQAQVALFTCSQQIRHLLSVAQDLGLAGAVQRALQDELVVASVGPITAESLQQYGITSDIVPGHPKLGHLVLAVARRARALSEQKRTRSAQALLGASRAK